MKKSLIISFVLLTTITLVGCTNTQDKQLQQQNDLLKQQNTLLKQQTNSQDINTNPPGYVIDNNTTGNTNPTGNTKTIPFDAVAPANNNNTYTDKEFTNQ
ncbi:MAG: hypothetical protein WAZ12_00485 [Candidatus Absconditicoccaceae bacterium]